jgi:hypothetical protein
VLHNRYSSLLLGSSEEEEEEMDRTHSSLPRDEEFYSGWGGDYLGDLGVDGSITLKWVLR